jgi:hypothetical protein
MSSDNAVDAADFELLSLANEKGKFALQLGYIMKPQMQEAFERGIDNHWFDFVDLSPISNGPHIIMRVFRLTDKGWQRRGQLRKHGV